MPIFRDIHTVLLQNTLLILALVRVIMYPVHVAVNADVRAHNAAVAVAVVNSKVTNKNIKLREKLEADNNPQLQLSHKNQRLAASCQRAEYQPPCSDTQVIAMCKFGKLQHFPVRLVRSFEHTLWPIRLLRW